MRHFQQLYRVIKHNITNKLTGNCQELFRNSSEVVKNCSIKSLEKSLIQK